MNYGPFLKDLARLIEAVEAEKDPHKGSKFLLGATTEQNLHRLSWLIREFELIDLLISQVLLFFPILDIVI